MTATTFAKLITDGTAPATLEALAKAQIAGKDTGLQKHNYIAAIQKRADLVYPATLSLQQRFARCLEDDTGKLFYAASKAASGSEVVSPGPDEPDDENFSGPAYAEMEVLAHDLQLANPNLSMQQAFSRVYTSPKNKDLRARIIAEATARARGMAKAASVAQVGDIPNLDGVSPSATDEMNQIVMTRIKDNPKLSYAQAFTEEYLLPKNRSLKERIDQEGIEAAQRLGGMPPPFPASAFKSKGQAHDKLEKLTADLEAREPTLSHAQAYAKIYTDPANIALRDASKIEHLQAAK
jgi:hypothetical protein